MNWKGIVAAVVVVAVISIVVLLPVKPGQVTPPIVDSAEIKDSSLVSSSLKPQDTPEMTDSVTIENQTNTNFIIDEKGIRHFSFSVKDKTIIKP